MIVGDLSFSDDFDGPSLAAWWENEIDWSDPVFDSGSIVANMVDNGWQIVTVGEVAGDVTVTFAFTVTADFDPGTTTASVDWGIEEFPSRTRTAGVHFGYAAGTRGFFGGTLTDSDSDVFDPVAGDYVIEAVLNRAAGSIVATLTEVGNPTPLSVLTAGAPGELDALNAAGSRLVFAVHNDDPDSPFIAVDSFTIEATGVDVVAPPPSSPPTTSVQGEPRPSLALYAEIETNSGRVYRIDADHPDPAFRLTTAKFGTRLMEGFTTGSGTVSRDIRRYWPDLRLNATLRFVGEAARIAYEGRLSRFPASNDEGHRISLEAVGWLTHARDRKRTYDPSALTAADAIRASAAAFCPLFDTSGVEDAGTDLVTAAPWDDLTDPLDMWLGLNAAYLRQLAVWQNRRLTWAPLNLTRENWVARLDEGASVAFDGPSIEGRASGVQVEYDDVDTSTREVLTPEGTPSLAVTDPDILDSLDGVAIVPTITLSRGNTAAGAERIGVAVLSDLVRPKSPCRLTIRGHIRDRSGNWQQGWLPRAGQTVVLEDYDAAPPRLIHETTWDQESLTLTMDLDADAKTMDALIAQAGG